MGKRVVCYTSGFVVFFIFCSYIFLCKSEFWWLFSNSIELKRIGFDWIYSAWGASLGIHGTIGALSLTFMSMIVDAINKGTPPALESYVRKKMLDEINLLQFGIDAISTLIISFFFFIFGGGLIQYVVSQMLSLYFLLKYFKTYLNLFKISRNKNFAIDFLQTHCSFIVDRYTLVEDANAELRRKISTLVESDSRVYYSYGKMRLRKQQPISISIDYDVNNIVIDVSLEKIRMLDGIFNELKKKGAINEYEIVIPSVDLHNMIQKGMVCNYISNVELKDKDSKKIYQLMSGVLINKDKHEVIQTYKELTHGVVMYLINSILENNREGIQKSINSFSCLINGNVSTYPFEMVSELSYQYLVGSGVSKNSINELMRNISELNLNLRDKTAALEVIIKIARLSLNRDDFNAFIENHEDTLNHFLSYDLDNVGYYEVLRSLIESQCNELDYDAIIFWGKYFHVNTRHLSIKYLSLEKRNASEIISIICKVQRVVLTVLHMRWHTLITKGGSEIECASIFTASKIWTDLAIFSNYTDEIQLYNILFTAYEERIRFVIDEQRIRELPGGEAYTVTEHHYAKQALVLVLLVLDLNLRGFNLRYLYDWRSLVDIMRFSSSDYEKLIKICDSPELELMLLSLDYKEEKVKVGIGFIKDKLSAMLEYKGKEVSRAVINAEMNKDLLLRFKNDVNEQVIKWFSSILNVDLCTLPISNKTIELFYYASKREFLPVVDCVSYLSSAGIYGDEIISMYKMQLLDCIKNNSKRLLKFNDSDLDKNNSIMFINKKSMIKYNYEIYKQYRLVYYFDDGRDLADVYVVSLSDYIFSRGFNSNNACHIEIKEITKSNYHLYTKLKNLNDDDEVFEKVILKFYPNLKVSLRDNAVIYAE